MHFLLIFLFIFSSNPVWAQSNRTLAIDEALSNVEKAKSAPKADEWEKRNADVPYIALVNEYDKKINEDLSYVEDYHVRIKVQNAEAQLGQWPIYYNKSRQEIVSIKAIVEHTDGKVVEATQVEDYAAAQDAGRYDEMRVKVINLPEVQVGSIIDVKAKTKYKRKIMAGQFWDEISYPAIPTKFSKHTYSFPDSRAIKFNIYNTKIKPQVEKKGGVTTYTFTHEKTIDVGSEEMMPPLDEVVGVISLSTMNDWAQAAHWWREAEKVNIVTDRDITLEAVKLSKDGTQKDKARAIIEFIQDNFRLVSIGLGDHMTELHTTADVFKDRYGDRKDLTLVAKQMLQIAGIDSSIAFFSGEYNGNPKHRLPNFSMFDHMLLKVTLDGAPYYVDVPAKGFDFGQLPADYDNGHVFVIEANSYKFENVPVSPEDTHALITKSDIKVMEDGSALFDVHVQMPLEASVDFKSRWKTMGKEEKDAFFKDMETSFGANVKLTEHVVKGVDARYGVVELFLKYEGPQVYPIVNDMILLKEEQQGAFPEFAEKRTYPIFMPNNSLIKNHNVYHVSQDLKIDFVPESFNLKYDFVEVNHKYAKSSDNIVSAESAYRMKRVLLPAERYKEIKQFQNELAEKTRQYIVVKKKSGVSKDAKDWIRNQ